MKDDQIIYFDNYDDARTLVDRIADRTKVFNHTMTEPEKEAMAHLLADVGIAVSDLIDVSHLADNYAINAELIYPTDYDAYDMKQVREDALFCWEINGETCYCLQW